MVETLGEPYWRIHYDPVGCDAKLQESAWRYGQELRRWTDPECTIYPVLYGVHYLLRERRDVALHERVAAEFPLPRYRCTPLYTR